MQKAIKMERIYVHTVRPVLRCHPWDNDKLKVAF